MSLAASIDEYLRKRLMPAENVIHRLAGVEMCGSSIPVEKVGGDLLEYINFQQRYNIDARIAHAYKLFREYREPLREDARPRDKVDAHVQWLQSRLDYTSCDASQYRKAKSSEQLRIAENLQELYTTAGVLLVDAQGHGIIAAKIASTVHDTFHTAMLSELDNNGKTTPDFFERINLRFAQLVTARNAFNLGAEDSPREIATMLYGEIRPDGIFRFVNFGHPPPLVFSAEYGKFMEINKNCTMQFPALGLEIPEDHPDRSKYVSIKLRTRQMSSSDLEEITLMGKGDILFLYTDGVFDGSDVQNRKEIERIIEKHKHEPTRTICDAILEHAIRNDDHLRQIDESDLIDDKTVLIIRNG